MIYLVPESTLKDKILSAVHDAPLAGHPGYLKTYRKVRERFSWKGLKEDVLWYVRKCMTFQQNNLELTHPTCLIQSLPILENKWEIISMDFITRFPKVEGRDCIYVLVYKLTKYTHFFSIPSKYSASQTTDIFFREVFKLHGLLRYIVSDRDNGFLSAFWQEIFRLSGTKLTHSTSYHP
jgi:hypothetical protein